MKVTKIHILLFTLCLGFFACSSDDDEPSQETTNVSKDMDDDNTDDETSDGGDSSDENPDNGDPGQDGTDVTTVTKTEFRFMRDADRDAVYDEAGAFEKYIYNFSGNDFNIGIYQANTDNTYEIKLTGRVLKKEFTRELFLATATPNPDFILYTLTTSDFRIDPDTYDAVIVEKETNQTFDIESLKLNSNPDDVPYDIISTNSAYNLGAIEFSDVTFDAINSPPVYTDAGEIDLGDREINLRAKSGLRTQEIAKLEVYTTDGVFVKTIFPSTTVSHPDGGALHYEINSSEFADITLGTYLFRLVENQNFVPELNKTSELTVYEIVNSL